MLQKTLSQDELSRLEKFHFDIDRERMLVARCALRDILAQYLHQAPSAIQFQYTDLGKPYLNASTLKFNVSHAHHCILIAIANDMDIGIDVEYHQKTVDYLSIAQEFFAHDEYTNLLKFTPKERHLAFYRLWTQKEAFLKGIGTGLSVPLNQSETLKKSEKYNKWQISEIHLGEDYVAALATAEKHEKFFFWDWEQFKRD